LEKIFHGLHHDGKWEKLVLKIEIIAEHGKERLKKVQCSLFDKGRQRKAFYCVGKPMTMLLMMTFVCFGIWLLSANKNYWKV
jgi:hypothetical protein